MQGNMILVYKILRADNQSLCKTIGLWTRGHNFKLHKPFVQTTICKHFFNIRAINNYSSFPYKVVNAVFSDSFKSRLDNILQDKIYVLIKQNSQKQAKNTTYSWFTRFY